MTEAPVIKACFSDWRTVKTRKTLQLIFEIPLEQQGEVLTRLGAPMPDQEKWVAIALLDKLVAAETEHQRNERRRAAKARYDAKSPGEQMVVQAAMLAKNPEFKNWLRDKHVYDEPDAYIKRLCKISSKTELADDPEAQFRFRQIVTNFEADTGRIAEIRA